MKKITLLLMLGILVSCNKDEETLNNDEVTAVGQDSVRSVEEINEYITRQLETSGDMKWDKAEILYSAAVHGGNMLTVGYGKEGEFFSERGQKGTQLLAAKKQLIETVKDTEPVSQESIVVEADEILNVMEVKVTSLATVEALLKANDVRYIEPNGYNHYRSSGAVAKKSGSGCDKGSQEFNRADYKNIAPNALQPWNYTNHNIDKAWSISTGVGVTVGLIDTGLSANQSKLGNSFNDGQSSGRTVEREGVFIDSPWFWSRGADGSNDKCGHGTAMASAIASPRNDDNLPVGVAYNSNLVAYRAAEDVLIDDYHEKKGVSEALVALANRSDVKIISMSMGSLFSVGNIEDAIRYAHSKGKLIYRGRYLSTY